ncbi:MAG: DUF480 domain-containing protein [Planctomycetes bacterium]|nr:DUF480 domain-containing protein [Planctomycetota bacterium]
MDDAIPTPESVQALVKWRAMSSRQRRVVGVLIEKAKTTADAYPMTVNAIVTACNQKTNRAPLTNYSAEDIEDILTELRGIGAVVELQGGGRTPRYKHCMYEWLGVDKVELAVMGELLLRGEQTVGELRGRAARMEPIADLAALRPILTSLLAKHLILTLTPEGRGQVVSHALYKDRERDELVAQYEGGAARPGPDGAPESTVEHRSDASTLDALRFEIAALRDAISRVEDRLAALESAVGVM